MKKLFSLIILTILGSTAAVAQNPIYLWAKNLGGVSSDFTYTMAVDDSENVYIAGNFSGPADFDPGPGVYTLSGTGSIFLAKYTSAGALVWADQMGGPLTEKTEKIVLDTAGNIYIVGYYSSASADFDPGPGVYALTNGSTSSSNGFFAKYSNSGNLIWADALDGTSTVEAHSIAVNSSGEVYVTGRFYSACDFDPGASVVNLVSAGSSDSFYAKYSASGSYIWSEKIGGTSSEEPWDLVVDNAGNLYTIGSFDGTVDFDPGAPVVSLTANYDIYIAKYSTTGAYVWAGKLQDVWVSGSYKSNIRLDNANNVYITSNYGNAIDCDPSAGSYLLSNSGSYDSFFAKYDNNGNLIFAKSFYSSISVASSGEYINDLFVDPASGMIYVTGYYAGQVDFDPGAGTHNLISGGPSGWSNLFFAKYDASGNYVWANSIGLSNNYPDQGFGITMKNSNIYLSGYFTGSSVSFDPAGAAPTLSTNSSSTDIFIAKYSDCSIAPSQPGPINGALTLCNGTTSSYNVSTVSGASSYTWTLPGGWTGTSSTNSILATAGTTGGTLTVTANNPCGTSTTQTLVVTVSNPALALTPASATCFGSCNGSITAVASGGIAPYSYSPSLSNLCASSYTVTATDNIGCTTTQSTTVTEPSQISVTSSATPSTYCSGNCSQLVCNSSGGTPGYTYLWTPGNITTPTANVCPTVTTTYTCTVTDANACTQTTTVTITVNPLPTVTYVESQSSVCINWNPITLSAGSPAGGTYSGPGVTGNQFDPASAGAGTWNVVYTYADGNSCADSVTQQITVDLCLGINQNTSDASIAVYPNPFNSVITVLSDGTKSNLEIYNLLGEIVYRSQIQNPKTEIDLAKVPAGVYFVRISTDEKEYTKKIIKN